MSLTAAELRGFVLDLAARDDAWQHLVSHASGGRLYHRVWDDREVNAWLICWDHDHDTGWHDHDDSAAAIHVVEGSVREQRLRVSGAPSSRLLDAGATFLVPASAIHRVRHAGPTPSVSVHAYSPPLTRTGAYTIGSDGELRREAQTSDDELRPQPAPLRPALA